MTIAMGLKILPCIHDHRHGFMITDRQGFMIIGGGVAIVAGGRSTRRRNATKTALNGTEAKQRSARCLIGINASDATAR